MSKYFNLPAKCMAGRLFARVANSHLLAYIILNDYSGITVIIPIFSLKCFYGKLRVDDFVVSDINKAFQIQHRKCTEAV